MEIESKSKRLLDTTLQFKERVLVADGIVQRRLSGIPMGRRVGGLDGWMMDDGREAGKFACDTLW